MALIDLTTANRGYPLPAGANDLSDDVQRLILAIQGIDADVAAALTSLAAVAPITDPVFTGEPEAPTPVSGDDSNRLATTAFVKAAFDLLIGAAPGALDTLNELAAALGDDPAFATTVTNALAAINAALATKLDKAGGTMAGNISFSGINDGIVLATGGKLFDQADATILHASGDKFAIRLEDGSVTIFEANNSYLSFKGAKVPHAGNMSGVTAAERKLIREGVSAIGNLHKVNYITASGTFTPHADTKFLEVFVLGGGGAGGGANTAGSTSVSVGGGGASGAWCQKFFAATGPATVTVGAGGAGTAGGNGGTGGTSGFNDGTNAMVAPGGPGAVYVGGSPGTQVGTAASNSAAATGGNLNGSGGGAGGGFAIDDSVTEGGYGGLLISGAGGASPLGAGGPARVLRATASQAGGGISAAGYGDGGGGALSYGSGGPAAGGQGSAGVVIVKEYR